MKKFSCLAQLLLLLVLFGGATCSPATVDCVTDYDCSDYSYCGGDGYCYLYEGSCEINEDCLDTEYCWDDNWCYPVECNIDADCADWGEGFVCDYYACFYGAECGSDNDCPDEYYCGEDAYCHLASCTKDEDCSGRDVCSNGKCVASTGGCNPPCASNEKCIHQVCVAQGDTDAGHEDGGATDSGTTDAGDNTLGTGNATLKLNIVANFTPHYTCPNQYLYPDVGADYEDCDKGILRVDLIQSDSCFDTDAPHLRYIHQPEISLKGGSTAAQSITLTHLPEGKAVVVCPWLDSNKDGVLTDGDLTTLGRNDDPSYTLEDFLPHLGKTATLGTDTELDFDLGFTYFGVDKTVVPETGKRMLIAYSNRLNLLDMASLALVENKEKKLTLDGQDALGISVVVPWLDNTYLAGVRHANGTKYFVPVSISDNILQLNGSVIVPEIATNDDVAKGYIFERNGIMRLIAIDNSQTAPRAYYAALNGLDTATQATPPIQATELNLASFKPSNAPTENTAYLPLYARYYKNQMYFSMQGGTDQKNYLWVFDIGTGVLLNGVSYNAGSARADGAKCSVDKLNGALAVGQIGSKELAVIGNGQTITVYDISVTPTRIDYGTGTEMGGDLVVREWGQLIINFRQDPDGKLYALPYCVGSVVEELPTPGTTPKDIFRQSVLKLDIVNDKLNIASDGEALAEYDMIGRSWDQWVIDRSGVNHWGDLPGQWALPSGFMVISSNYIFVTTRISRQDQILVIERTSRNILPFGWENTWNYFMNLELFDEAAAGVLPFGLWPVTEIDGHEYKPINETNPPSTDTRVEVKVIELLE